MNENEYLIFAEAVDLCADNYPFRCLVMPYYHEVKRAFGPSGTIAYHAKGHKAPSVELFRCDLSAPWHNIFGKVFFYNDEVATYLKMFE